MKTVIILIYMFFCLPFAYYINVFLHEVGHLLFGAITGYKIYGFQIGKIIFIKNVCERKWEKKTLKIPGVAGKCLMMPGNTEDIGKYPIILYYAGGVIFNIMFALILIPWIILFKNNKIILVPIVMLFETSVFFTFANGIPYYTESIGLGSDGYWIRKLKMDNEIRKCVYYLHCILGLECTGTRLKNIAEYYFLAYSELDSGKKGIADLKLYHAEYLIDCNQYEIAARILDELINEKVITGSEYERIKCERIWIALQKQEVELIKQLFDNSLKEFVNNNQYSDFKVMRMLHLYYISLNDNKKSEFIMTEFDRLCISYPSTGRIVMEKDLIHRSINI